MASIATQPAGPVSPYRPIFYSVNTDTGPTDFEKIVATVYDANSGEIIATYRKDWIRQGGTSPNFFYTFEVDVSEAVGAIMSPFADEVSGVFLPFTDRVEYAPESTARIYVKFRFLYRTGDNVLEDYGQELTSNTVTVLPVIRQHAESQSLSEYVTNPDRALLHDPPAAGIEIALGEAFAASIVCHTNITRARIVATTSAGSETGYLLADPGSLSTYTDKRVMSVGVGPRNINSYISTDFDGTPVTITADTVYYTVDFGRLVSGTWESLSRTIRFNVSATCDSGIRLHWMNQRGGVDAWTFDARRVKSLDANGDFGRVALPYTHDRQRRGAFASSVRANTVWEVESRIIHGSAAEYAAGVVQSVEVYAEGRLADYYTPVVLQGGTFTIDDTEDVGTILRFRVLESNEILTQKM